MKKLLISTLFILSFSFLNATERITSFDVDMTVAKDGSAKVTENISVISEHNNIKRGIYRDIPVNSHSQISPLSLSMDGQIAPFFTEKKDNNLRINFGNDDFISEGPHSYSLTYSVSRAAKPFRKYDEVYWNVTGNYWQFPIDEASFKLILPEGANPIESKISLYTGAAGSKASDAQKGEGLYFKTTRPLEAGEGFTVAVPWQKGIITFPPIPLWQNPEIMIPLVVVILIVYFFLTWTKYGRDPQARVVRLYKPPEGISPAFARYLSGMGYDSKIFTVTLVSLTLKGAVKITQEEKSSFLGGKEYVIRTCELPQNVSLSEEENLMYESLQAQEMLPQNANGFVINQKNRDKLFALNNALTENLKKQENKQYFKRNWGFVIPVFLIMLLFCYLSLIFMTVTIFCSFIALIAASKKGRPLLIVMACIFLFGIYMSSAQLMKSVDALQLMFAGGAVFMVIYISAYIYLIKAYTVFGRGIMDQIDGFKEYLSTAEKYRMEISDPTDAQQLFCDYYAYASAFDVESKWTKYFETALGKSMVEEGMRARGLSSGAFAGGVANFSNSVNSAFAMSGGSGSGGGGGGGRGAGAPPPTDSHDKETEGLFSNARKFENVKGIGDVFAGTVPGEDPFDGHAEGFRHATRGGVVHPDAGDHSFCAENVEGVIAAGGGGFAGVAAMTETLLDEVTDLEFFGIFDIAADDSAEADRRVGQPFDRGPQSVTVPGLVGHLPFEPGV